MIEIIGILFFFSSRRRHTRWNCDWSSDVCSSDLEPGVLDGQGGVGGEGLEETHGLRVAHPGRLAADTQDADNLLLTEQWNGQQCPIARLELRGPPGTLIDPLDHDVRNLGWLTQERRSAR